MPRVRVLVLGIVSFLALAGASLTPAHAHFLFIHVRPLTEGGRFAEVYFSEQAEAGDPRYLGKIAATTKLWLQTRPGEFQPIAHRSESDRLRALIPASGAVAVVGECRYGVLQRPNAPPFLLVYYPKAVAGSPDQVNRFQARVNQHLEIQPTVHNDRLRLVALKDGKPLPNVEIIAIDADLKETKLTANAEGEVEWKPSAPGRHSIYFRHDEKVSGQENGQSYEEIRSFASLALQWPQQRTQADKEAVALFQRALDSRAQWANFTGFSAVVEGSVDGTSFAGKLEVDAEGLVKVEVDNEPARKWVKDQVSSLVMHRRTDSHQQSEPIVWFPDEDEEHPLGRLVVFEGGQFASTYRIKNNEISVVNRHIGKSVMAITTLETTRNAEGKSLPKCYTVQFWDDSTQQLRKVETIQDAWRRFGALDLPVEHSVTTSDGRGLTCKVLRLSDVKVGSLGR